MPPLQVVLGCHAVLANGHAIVHVGASHVAIAAKDFQRDVIILGSSYSIVPEYTWDPLNDNGTSRAPLCCQVLLKTGVWVGSLQAYAA